MLAGAVADAAALLVLAGGRSTRMGSDKAWRPVGGQPALLRVLAAGREAGVDACVVVGSPGQPLPPLPAGVERVDDPSAHRHEGPLRGLGAGLESLAARGVALACLASCDLLWLGPAHVQHLLDLLRASPELDAVVPEGEPRADGTRVLHPLCGAVRVAAAVEVARARLEAGQRAARALVLGLRSRGLGVATLPEPRVVLACNTPEQWAEVEAALRVEGRLGRG